jgi:hypothetical protein
MALYNTPPVRLPFTAGADLSGSRYRAVALNTSGLVVLPSAAGAAVIGILDDLGVGGGVSGSRVTVIVQGGARAEAHEAFNAGVDLVADATTGRVGGSATSGHRRIAVALEAAGAQGDIVSVHVDRDGAVA